MAGTKAEPTFTAKDFACMIAILRMAGGSFGKKEFEILSKMDGGRTASSYDHSTRDIRNQATEIIKKVNSGELDNVPLPSGGPKRAKSATASPAGVTKSAGSKRAVATKANGDEGSIGGSRPAKKSKVKEEEEEPEPEPESEFDRQFFANMSPDSEFC